MQCGKSLYSGRVHTCGPGQGHLGAAHVTGRMQCLLQAIYHFDYFLPQIAVSHDELKEV